MLGYLSGVLVPIIPLCQDRCVAPDEMHLMKNENRTLLVARRSKLATHYHLAHIYRERQEELDAPAA